MNVRWLCAILAVSPCPLSRGASALAQGNEIIERTQRANSLSGIVIDQMGASVAGVAVAECAADFNDCAVVEHTDKDGRFYIRSVRKGNVHYLRFISLGMDEERETVKLSTFSGKLKIRLVVGV
jgi:hypothetical protein